MRFLAILIIASVILSVAKALTLALILLLLVSITWALITKPCELFAFLLFGLLSTALSARPATTILCIAAVAIVVAVRKPVSDQGPK